jgi:sugar fermentation stimulation protein A
VIPFPTPQRTGAFLTRLNRFAALIDLGDQQVIAHLPNTGRMTELLVTGHPVVVIERPSLIRKTHFDLVLVQYHGHWVSVDSRLPSQVIYQALVEGTLEPWCGCTRVRREAVYGESRLDLELWRDQQRCLVETKSVNLVVEGCALFPDAPTLRGARHLRSLMTAAAAGMDASVVFVIQRPDALSFSPFDEADPEFGRTLREASRAGVGVHAYRCLVTPEGMSIEASVPVELY